MKQETKNKIQFAVIAILLLTIGGFYYNQSAIVDDELLQDKLGEAYQAGGRDGQISVVSQVFDMASKCQQIPITVKNQTLSLVAVECIEMAAKQQQIAEQNKQLLESEE